MNVRGARQVYPLRRAPLRRCAARLLHPGAPATRTRFEITNVQYGTDPGDLPSLPVTGATGVVLMVVVGGTLIALGVALSASSRRRRAQQA
ncbi:LPXTG cell wall anchor domain-containing protein [Xylanimonas ulmi]|uniref:LPXTG-motif cell wall-anchored protein/predicted secreted protein with PEP-CTERM sorting signal n=1 Tax=Xylanimonas ulmi TaxID=228973 RepID=A0A4Q7M5U3_9MICO|nr:LPXTG cell wall anchor domain-containing protein [Xylanibacterium ulmi]RZS61958.1 LPXTG-motif cell wall-anchored protein/predicted secreted protein with PEP-CTERM sorting signal [Xylanibacterium ulmi]